MTFITSPANIVKSTLNSFTAYDISANSSLTGTGELNSQPNVGCACFSTQNGTLYFQFSIDGTTWSSYPTTGFTITANINEFHTAVKLGRYFRIYFVNSSTNATLTLATYYGQFGQGILPLNQSITNDNDSILTRSVLTGQTDGGQYLNVPITQEGHLEVAIHNPLLPFGSIHTENMTPIFQTQNVYGFNSNYQLKTEINSGSVSVADNMIVCSTSSTTGSIAYFNSIPIAQYSAGQGLIGRFTAIFQSGASSGTTQQVGLSNGQDFLAFGYSGSTFGIYYNTFGVREVRKLAISGTSGATSATLILNGDSYTVPIVNGTGATSVASQIANYSVGAGRGYVGWTCVAIGADVYFLNYRSRPLAGSFSLTLTGITGTFTTSITGVNPQTTFIPQSSFNGDKLDGTGASGFTINPAKGNVYQIGLQYLGFGTITFLVETISGSNNYTWTICHSLQLPNTLTTTSMSIPAFNFAINTQNAGTTDVISVKNASYSCFTEGVPKYTGSLFSYSNFTTSAITTNLVSLYQIQNRLLFNNKTNLVVIKVVSLQVAVRNTNAGGILYLIKNICKTTGGASVWTTFPNYSEYSSGNSVSLTDTTGVLNTLTITDIPKEQVIGTYILSETSSLSETLEIPISLYQGETLTFAVRTTSGTSSLFAVSFNTREDY